MLPRMSVYKICEEHQPQNTLWLGADNTNGGACLAERVGTFSRVSS